MVHQAPQQQQPLDRDFAALADPTRRGILERLGEGDASISELAELHAMTRTGVKKHVGVLEEAGLVTTAKVGRVRSCRLAPNQLDEATQWIEAHRRAMAARFDRFAELLHREQRKDTT